MTAEVMSDLMSPDEIKKTARPWNIAFVVVVTTAFVMPALFASYLDESASSRAYDWGRTLGSLFFCWGFSWLLTRKRSELVQARARFVAGVLVCILLGVNVLNAMENDRMAKKFAAEFLALSDQFEKKFQEFGERFGAIDLSVYLTAESLTNPNSLSAGRATLAQFRMLIQERNLLVQNMTAEGNTHIQGIPDESMRRSARKGFDTNQQNSLPLFEELGKTQMAAASAVEKVFDWASKNSGKLRAKDGQLVFASVAQRQEYLSLIDQLNSAAKQEEAVAAKFVANQEKAQARLTEAKKELSQFVSGAQ